MTSPGGLSKRLFAAVALALAVGAAVTAFVMRSAAKTARLRQTPVGAYLIPLEDTGKPGARREAFLPLAIRYGEQTQLPAGSQALLLSPLSGENKVVTGPLSVSPDGKKPAEFSFLASPLNEVFAQVESFREKTGSFAITSPVGVTRFLNPVIVWTAQPGKHYDVAIIDAADTYVPPRVATRVMPPLALSDLETPQRRQLGADRNYQILVRETGAAQISGAARFLTLPDARLDATLPATPADLLAEAFSAMAQKPYRTGDAWLALSRLPPEWRSTELALRLRLCVAVELGLGNEMSAAKNEAAALFQP